MGEIGGSGSRNDDDTSPGALELEPTRLPSPPGGMSRIDTLPEDFIAMLSHRPHMAGDVLAGRYKLVESLGDGAMGQVFVAENLAIGRRVAVKLLKAELLADASFRKRFQQEASATAAVEHRNVARFIDLIVGDPTFLVMEYVTGPTLAKVLRQEKKLHWVRAVTLGIRLCWALDAAHKHGIVHRDVKPANVILSADPELGEEPKLIDFGLAKVPSIVGAETLTRTGQIIGTPHYMSPEQIANKDVDARSDVYALGCLLYHMLSGAPPFAGSEDVQTLYKQISEEPPSLATHSLPDDLVAIVTRALRKEPEARFRDMRDMAAALTAADRRSRSSTNPAATSAGFGPSTERTELVPHRRRRAPSWPILAASLLAAGAAVAMTYVHSRTPPELLVVTSRPQDADVEVDGSRRGKTPAAIHGIKPGRHTVRVSHADRTTVEQFVEIAPDGRAAVDVALAPMTRPLQIVSEPPGALVYVDGRLATGQTPLVLSITANDFHEIRIENPGYLSWIRALKPEDTVALLDATLQREREARATVWIDSNRAAEVFIDGGDTGLVTPTVGIRVGPGGHKIELRHDDGHALATTTINLAQGETAHVTLDAPAVTSK